MDNHDSDRLNTRDLPVYIWNNKQEGKDQYARFAKQFEIGIKHLRYLLDPEAVQRLLGAHPGPAPAGAAARREWRDDLTRYEARLAKIDEHFSSALSALEDSFDFATSPRHIIDKAIENRPEDVPPGEWNYERKFRAAWEALRAEYQPSTAVDLSQLRDQIFALSDQIPGGFDQFKSEFHRLHAEIVATRVPDAILPRELNGIVREGIRNRTVWAHVGYNLYKDNPDAPWQRTFDEVSAFLTSFRQKDIDPYGEARGGPIVGHTSIAANSAVTPAPDAKMAGAKRQHANPRDASGRFHKSQKTSATETYSQGKYKYTSSQTTSRDDVSAPMGDRRCTRCWKGGHIYRDCNETKCVCGKTLTAGQPICYGYDSHPTSAQFPEGKFPKFLADIIEAFRRGKSTLQSAPSPPPNAGKSKNGPVTRSKFRKGAKAMAAHVAEELVRRGVAGENLDKSN